MPPIRLLAERALRSAGGPPDADIPRAARPRLGGISFLHRFGSALNHHVHLHACVTDGVFGPAAAEAPASVSRRLCAESQAQAHRHGTGNRQRQQATGGHDQKARSHDASRIAWAKLMARVGEEFPLECPNCGGDIRLIAFITEPGPIRKILTHLGEPLEPPPISPARGPPTDWGELVQVHDDRAIFQESPEDLPAIDIHSV
jgi:hypothetical protein